MPKKQKKAVTKKKKAKLHEKEGIAYIKASFNNTIITITDLKGNVIEWASCGTAGFRSSRKSTSYAAQITAKDIAKSILNRGLKSIHVKVNGPGSGRDSAVRSLQGEGLEILSIIDITPIPHNGCRPPKRRRI